MNTEPNLKGSRVLVVEDDYLLAWDTGDALRRAGAEVVGPVANESSALEAIRQGHLHAAVTDVNLGRGPSFEIAHSLKQAGIPFVFLTGYDQLSIPDDLQTAPRLVKPIDTNQIVREIGRLLE